MSVKELTMNDFYTFSSKGYLTTVSVFPELCEPLMYDAAFNFMNNKIIKGDWSGFEFPLIFRQTHEGKKFRDILDMRWPGAYLISDRMKGILEENGITGWKSYPVVIYDKKGGTIEGYNGFSVVGRSGPMDLKSQPTEYYVRFDGSVSNRLDYIGGWFDLNTWDGSDIFILEDSLWTIMTARLYKILRKEKITALDCERVSDLRLDSKLFK